MNKNDYVNKVLSYVPSVVKGSVKMELEAHIEDRAEYFEQCGYSTDMAEDMAAERMGSADIVGPELSKLHSDKANKIFSAILFLAYVVMSTLFAMTILAWGSSIDLLNLIAEYLYFSLSVAGLLLSNRLRRNIPVFVSLVFTMCFLVGKLGFSPCSVILYCVYTLFTGQVNDFVIVSGLKNSIAGNALAIASAVFYILWLLPFAVTFINNYKLKKSTYSKKDVTVDKVLKRAVIIVFILCTVFTAGFYALKINSDSGVYMGSSADSYYDGVCILESDEPVDIKECFNNSKNTADYVYKRYNWDVLEADSEGYKSKDMFVDIAELQYNSFINYDFSILTSDFVPSKKYITAIPVRFDDTHYTENLADYIIPCFDNSMWYEADNTDVLKGSLDVVNADVKMSDYEIHLIYLAGRSDEDVIEYTKKILYDIGYWFDEEYIKKFCALTNSVYLGNEGSEEYIYHFLINDRIDVYIACSDSNTVDGKAVFEIDGESICEYKF